MRGKGGYGSVAVMLFKAGLRQEFCQPATWASQALFLAVILFVFSNLWQSTFESGFSQTAMPADFVWYLLITELVTLSVPQVFRGIQDEIRSGDIVQRLLKPIPFPLLPVAQGMGTACARMVILLPLGICFAAALTGGFPSTGSGLVAALVLVPFAALTLIMYLTAIGLGAVWFYDVDPIYWVFSKAMFVLGGLMLPLTIYPPWLQHTAMLAPFYAMLYGVGRHVFAFSIPAFLSSVALLGFWLAVAFILLKTLYRRLTRQILIGGG